MDAPFISPISQTQDQKRRFDIGRVVRRAVQITRDHPISLIGVSLVLAGAPAATSRWVLALHPVHAGPFAFVYNLLLSAPILALGAIYTAWVALVAVDDATGQQHGRGVARLRLLAVRSGPLIANALLVYLGMYVAMFLILIPGIMVSVAWCIATPVLIVEGLGPVQALGRSAKLTRGNRWPIFGVMAVVWIAIALIQLMVISVSTGGLNLERWRTDPLLIYVVAPISGSVIHLILTVAIVSTYVELARLNEHAGFANVAEVFA